MAGFCYRSGPRALTLCGSRFHRKATDHNHHFTSLPRKNVHCFYKPACVFGNRSTRLLHTTPTHTHTPTLRHWMAQLMTPTHAAPTLSATEYGYPPSSTIVMDVDYHPDIDDEVDMADPESASVSTPEPVTEPKIPRPLNAFMLYRLDWLKSSKAKAKSKGRSETQGAISRKVSQAWKAEPEAVRDHYKLLAQQAALEHKRRYPTYKYKPGPPKHKNGVKVAPPAQNKRGRPRKVKMPQAVVVAQPASTGSLRSPREGSEETQASSEGANEVRTTFHFVLPYVDALFIMLGSASSRQRT